MMIGHQRDIMAALGIDVWIPKGAVCQPHRPSAWRDQAPQEALSEIILPKAPARLAQAKAAKANFIFTMDFPTALIDCLARSTV